MDRSFSALVGMMLLTGGVSGQATMSLHLLNDYPGAVCLDGTPGGYYYSPGSGDHVNDWVLFFQGGGWCYSEADCYGRSKTRLGSSSSWTQTIPCTGGPLDCDCGNNELFCQYNKVYMYYCDGDSFSGNRYDTVHYNGTQLYFRGHRILEATLMSLDKLADAPTPWSEARAVLLSGCSAGGLATYLHADYVQQSLPASATKYGAMPISGYFLKHNNTDNQPVYEDEIRTIFYLANATDGVDADCVAALEPSEQWKCNFAQYSYEFVNSPIFPLNSKYDSWQAGCILTAEFVQANSTQNGACGAAPGWRDCVHDLGACSQRQAATLSAYGWDFVALMNRSATAGKPGNGGFVDACLSHCECDFGWSKIKIGDYTVQDAVSKWWLGADNVPAAENWHWDCDFSANPPYNCNPTCAGGFSRNFDKL